MVTASNCYGCFSALQRAEIAEIEGGEVLYSRLPRRFSALQRAEIAEIYQRSSAELLLGCFSALQRAEIAEIDPRPSNPAPPIAFQCSSTSRNC